MGETTNIAWTDATWNPWQGCHKVSEACKNCYMFRDKRRFGQDPNTVIRSVDATFRKPLRWAASPKANAIKRIFTCSWSDFFIEEADAWRDEAWDVIRRTPRFIYQILTKRPERICECLPKDWMDVGTFDHVQIGITAENDMRLRQRADNLGGVPASSLFISVEPQLGMLNILPYASWIDWVICGCESGPGARETKLEWVRDLRDQCLEAGIPFFLKQLMIDGKLVSTPELDGQKWTQFPNV